MEIAIIGFALGVLGCQMQASLAALFWPLVGLLMTGFLVWLTRAWRRAAVLLCLGALLGFIQADWRAQLRLDDRLSAALEGQDIELVGRIAELPQGFDRGQRFRFVPDQAPAGVPEQILLSQYVLPAMLDVPPLIPRAGERWRLTMRLKRPHGSANPHGFDYEAWLFERGIGATGYVRPKGRNERLEAQAPGLAALIDRLRDGVRERFTRVLPDSPWRGVLVALAGGDQGSIPREQWRLFARTGVTHLMSISGLHVTMIGILAGGLLSCLWRRCAWLALRLPAQKAAVLGGCFAAGCYVLLAGSGVPAQRTFYMLAAAGLSLWLGIGAQVRRTLLLALLLVLLIDPWAVLSAGFWLSFTAVAALLMISAVSARAGLWREWWRAQWAVSLLTLPILLGLFQQFSLVSPLANAIAIPAISFVITPLALLFAALPLPSLAWLAETLLSGLMHFLHWCADVPFAVWQQAAPPWWLVLASCIGFGWSLMPRGVPARCSGLLCCVPLLAWTPPRPAAGTAQVRMLDVGQGLAVHVRTMSHDLLYDTGPLYSAEVDAGERVVLPYLRVEGVQALDMLVVSHDDSDHSGGADAILDGLPVREWRSSLHSGHALLSRQNLHRPCRKGDAWTWDGVRFEFLHPPADWAIHGDNSASCVLKVSTVGAALLLSGDAELRAEQAMLVDMAGKLAAPLLVAPHHGSRSSSHGDFIAAVLPREVLFSNGYRNRFHHPDETVVARYEAIGARTWRADRDGALSFELTGKAYTGPQTERSLHARYWHDSLQ